MTPHNVVMMGQGMGVSTWYAYTVVWMIPAGIRTGTRESKEKQQDEKAKQLCEWFPLARPQGLRPERGPALNDDSDSNPNPHSKRCGE